MAKTILLQEAQTADSVHAQEGDSMNNEMKTCWSKSSGRRFMGDRYSLAALTSSFARLLSSSKMLIASLESAISSSRAR